MTRAQDRSVRVRRRLRQQLASLYGDLCVKCRRSGGDTRLTLDHVVPASRGGAFQLHNLQLLCSPCNTAKADQHVDYRPFHPSTRSTKSEWHPWPWVPLLPLLLVLAGCHSGDPYRVTSDAERFGRRRA